MRKCIYLAAKAKYKDCIFIMSSLTILSSII